MNARLVKETRDLLPMFGASLLLIVVPYLIWRGRLEDFGCITFGLACAVLGGCAFGNELQHRTLSLLLSQPIARSALWRDKMLVMGACLAMSLAVTAVCISFFWSGPDLGLLALIGLCAFCGTPFWTLYLRHGIGGMAFAAAVPACITGSTALAAQWLSWDVELGVHVGVALVLVYCVVVYWLGYTRFQRLEAVDGPASRELSLPAGLASVFTRPLGLASARFRGPFATLLRKEYRLQQISLLLAGLFLLIAVVGGCFAGRNRDLSQLIVGLDYMFYMAILPLIVGASSVAEEKSWDLAEWHLTLPPSALKQWSAKMLAALSTSLVLGLLLPAALFLAVGRAFNEPDDGFFPLPVAAILCWTLGSLLLTSVGVYAASFSRSTLAAILAAFAILAAGHGVLFLTATCVFEVLHCLRLSPLYPQDELVLPSLCAGLFSMLCLIQRFAWSNFRRSGLSLRRVLAQLLVVLLAVALASLAFVLAVFLT